MTVDTQSWMASISKLIGGVLTMMLVDQNLIALDDRNRGAYGDLRFFSEETFGKMLPQRLTPVLGRYTKQERGIGTIWYEGNGLGKGTFAHGAASGATLRIDPEHDLVIVMTRDARGKNFRTYHPKFLQAVMGAAR